MARTNDVKAELIDGPTRERKISDRPLVRVPKWRALISREELCGGRKQMGKSAAL